MNQAAVRRHDFVNSRQADARALTSLGRKKRLKQVGTDELIHPGAVVCNGEKRARQCGIRDVQPINVGQNLNVAISGFYRDVPALRQSIACIQDQIEEDLLCLCGIELDQPKVGVKVQFQMDVFPDHARQKAAHSLGDFIQRDRVR